MTKPRQPDPAQNQKAPKAHRPKAPFVRKSEVPAPPASKPSHSAHSGQSIPVPFGARITRRAADRLRSGHLWVYASDIESLSSGSGEPPNLLPVADSRGLLLGTALYSPASQIALRLVSRDALDESAWLAVLEKRLQSAITRRLLHLVGADRKSDSCRLCFSEADEIPGLIIDKYGPLIIVQRLTRGLVNDAVRDVCVRVLCEAFSPETVMERPDPRIRELEGLAAPDPSPWWSANSAAPVTATQFHLNGLAFHFDANSGQKTGAFLDQAANYQAAQKHAGLHAPGGRALDVCTYQGGFALHLARVCKRVTGIDTSRSSLEVAERNLVANRSQLIAEVDWVEGDAFQILRDWAGAREQFDTIVLDPPAFAKSKRAIEGALRGYKELNLRALQMLRPGGLLVTCSCSHHVALTDLEAAVASAAADGHRRVRLLQRRGAAPDHPVVLNLPETGYLKCLVLQVD